MDYLFDEAARILAGPLPRRQALRRLVGMFAGGLLAAFGSGQAEAATCKPACSAGQT